MKKYFVASLLIVAALQGVQLNAQTPGTVKWSIYLGTGTGLPRGGDLSPPAIGPDGTIYAAYYGGYSFGYNDGKLYAINSNGTKKWELSMIAGGPAVDSNGNIYVGTDGPFYSISPDGSINWTFNDNNGEWTAPGIHKDGTIYTGGIYLRAINPDGSLKWSWDAHPQGIWSGYATVPVFSTEGMIYTGWDRHPEDDYLSAFDPDINAPDKLFKIDLDGYTQPMLDEAAIGNDGTIYISNQGSPGFLFAINPDFTEKWRVEIATDYNVFGGSPVIGADGTVYAGGEQGVGLTAVSPEGIIQWSFENSRGTPAIGNDGTLYVKGATYVPVEWKYYLLAINPDGTQKWASDYIGYFNGITLSDDGTIYVLSEDGYLYAFYSSSQGIGNTPWPMYRHDPQHSGQAASTNEPPIQNQTKVRNIWNILLLLSE